MNQAIELCPLSEEERRLFSECESAIEGGIEQAVAVGKSLDTIRERYLYREDYGSWPSYVQARWRMTVATANTWINASRLSVLLARAAPEAPPLGTIAAAQEMQRLAHIPGAVGDVWRDACESAGGPAGGPAVRDAVDRYLGVSLTVKRDLRRRDKWASGEFRSETPRIQVSLAPEEAVRVAQVAEEWRVSLAETCRRLVLSGLKEVSEAEGITTA